MASIKTYIAKDGTETYRVRYRTNGRSRSTTFATHADAERFGQMVDWWGPHRALDVLATAATSGRIAPSVLDSASFDPSGYFVYLLWGDDPDSPLYVGQSTNILSRLGTHMGDAQKRRLVRRVELIQCDDRLAMDAMEAALIREHCPVLNVMGKPPELKDMLL